jgi:hypothetical protein
MHLKFQTRLVQSSNGGMWSRTQMYSTQYMRVMEVHGHVLHGAFTRFQGRVNNDQMANASR